MYYISNHAIWQRKDGGKKLRVIFNGSQPTCSGNSLNDIMYGCPKFQNNISTIIVRWWMHKIFFCADVKMLYRQFKVHPGHLNLQRIIWFNSALEPIKHYTLLTVTNETNCAPFLALRTLKQLCRDNGEQFPESVKAINEELYVDELVCGTRDVKQARQRRNQII